MSVVSNDHLTLVPQTMFDGPVLEFDFRGLEIGIAEYEEGPTGCTVFHFPGGAATAVDIRGGVTGVSGNYEWCHVICLAGGSLFGLEAASGVHAELFARRNFTLDFDNFPLVNGAIIYDFGLRENRIYPDKELGRAALQTARSGYFPLGARGVGRSASTGSALEDEWAETTGQGGAFRQIGALKVAVFMVINSTGAIHNRAGQVVRGNRNPATGEHLSITGELERRLAEKARIQPRAGNSALTVVVTNQKLDKHNLRQMGRQVHTSLARVIHPFHTADDNDVCYAVTTGEVDSGMGGLTIGLIAAELAWDAALAIP